MKAKELMIGDWVLFHGLPRQVSFLKDDPKSHYDLSAALNGEGVYPIPLTDEILKKNGFEVYGHHAMLYVKKATTEESSIHIDYNESIDIVTPDYRYSGWCKTVHELQNCLRICKLNNIADNIKI